MSLLLKALKQAESAHAGKSGAERPAAGDDALELEPLPASAAEPATGWVEPPDLLFGSSGAATGAPRPTRGFRWPQLALVPTVALLAGVIAIGYGIYLYFALQPPDTALPPPVVATGAPPANEPAGGAPDVVSPLPEPARIADSEPPAAVPEAPPVEAARRDESQAPVATAARSVAESPAPATRTLPARAPAPPVDARAGLAPPAPPATAPIRFQADPQSALLTQAHAAYERGALVDAQRLYTQAAARNRSTDALLGLAAIAIAQNRETDAQRLYRDVLDLDPRNATAQAALLDLLGNTDGPATESRLKALIERDPSAQLYQTLGNLYADQQRWNDAQAAYYEAYRLAPDNADYAFNLAASLDQLRQGAAAARYYEKALATGGVHRFDRAQAEARLQQLKSGR